MSSLLRTSLHRAAVAVAIVFSVAVIIAVSDPRPRGSAGLDSDTASASGRRHTIIDPAAAASETKRSPVVLEMAPPLPVDPGETLLDVVARMASRAALDPAIVPAGNCTALAPQEAELPTAFSCSEGAVVSAAAGRVLIVSDIESPPQAQAPLTAGQWSWSRGLSLGKFVVIDHSATDAAQSVITVYSQLSEIDASLRPGMIIDGGHRLGGLGTVGETGVFTFGWEMWIDDTLAGVPAAADPPAADITFFQSTELAAIANQPADAGCTFPIDDRLSLPNSAREYRSGFHQGVDFGCGAPGQSAYAFADGVVTMIVDNVTEPTNEERDAILASAEAAGDTPHWILVMLYGNFVAVDHGTVDNVGRIVTIYAHLASVDGEIRLGASVAGGQRLGEIGASGTSVAARNAIASEPEAIHLHWELQIDDYYLAEGLSGAVTEQVYRSLMCHTSVALDCP